jgi:hypothetical protein
MQTRIAHAVAGILILSSLFLGINVNQNWFWLTGFVGANLLQNAFTNWCLMYVILRKLGIKKEGTTSCSR